MKVNKRFAFVLFFSFFLSGRCFAQEVLVAPYVTGKIPIDPVTSTKLFKKAKPLNITLLPQTITQPQGGGSVSSVSVRAVHNSSWIYFQLTWKDESQSNRILDTKDFSDAAALQFAIKGEGSPFMGDKDNTVNIWQWKAWWQKKKGAVEDLSAGAFGSLTTQASQDVFGSGIYKNGTWTVIFARSLKTKDTGDIQFEPGKTYSVNFAVWDGGKKERNGQKSVSLNWWKLKLAKVK